MGVLQHEMYQEPGAWAVDPVNPWHRGNAAADRMMPAGWWLVPGVVLGLGLWALLGIGVYSALAGGGDGADRVTMAAPLHIGNVAGE